ncbi:MAG: hypothetical protein AAF352_08630 [Pseudomonadota bacterium]
MVQQAEILAIGGRCAASLAITFARARPNHSVMVVIRNAALRRRITQGLLCADDTPVALPENLIIADPALLHCPKQIFIPAIPMVHLYQFLRDFSRHLQGFTGIIVSPNKGFSCHKDTPLLPTQTIIDGLQTCQFDHNDIVTLSGGNLAHDLWRDASMRIGLYGPKAKIVAQYFDEQTCTQTVTPEQTDAIIVEWLSAAKNAYALCCGIALAKGGVSYAAGIATQAEAEITRLLTHHYVSQSWDGTWPPSVRDDWNLSVIAGHTRNFQAGLGMAANKAVPHTTLEGVVAAKTFLELFAAYNIPHPILAMSRTIDMPRIVESAS